MRNISLSDARGGPPLNDGVTSDQSTAESNPQVGHAASDPRAATTADRLMQISRAADNQSLTFAQQHWRGQWVQSYQSYRSEYHSNSKYKSADYRNRSQIFRPKTKISVTKDLAAAAQTLFANVGTVSISAGDETDQLQVAGAEVMKQMIDYRLDRTSGTNSIPWFLTSMGARQNCQITGICVSKSFWDYLEDPSGRVNPKTGQVRRLRDKPAIDLIPPENIGMDPAAGWTDPVQSGAYFYARYPMHVQDVRERMLDKRVPWKPVTDAQIWARAKVKEFDLAEVRRAREGGRDRLDNQGATDKELDVVWVYEWFIRTHDGDWNFWTLGTEHLLSTPVQTEDAYPWNGGLRPYRIGLGNLEAHRIVPQSPVETLRPLQQEINDITNLRLDNLKQVIQPVALVRKGKGIDVDALKRRYPVVYISAEKDVEWDRPPDSAASSFAETSRLDTDFDDLAGTFNGGSVANNRQVGETVGGMRLMAGAANAVSEFYVRLWVETWVEPTLADLIKLEAYYEDDEKILALAKKRASAALKFGVSAISDEMLEQEVLVRVSAGVGSPDPMQKQAKMAQAVELTGKVVSASRKFASGEIRIKEGTILDEIWGNAGYRDGFDRFFEPGQPDPPQNNAKPPSKSINFKDLPPEGKAQLAGQAGIQLDPNALAGTEAASADGEGKQAAAERDGTMSIERLKSQTKIASELIRHGGERRAQGQQHKHENKQAFMDVLLELMGHHHDGKKFAAEQQDRAADRKAQAQQKKQQGNAAPAEAGM